MKLELHHINLSTDKVNKMNDFYLKVMNLKSLTFPNKSFISGDMFCNKALIKLGT